MPNKQLARGLFVEFGSSENPFQSPNGMEENLRLLDDHIATMTAGPPLARTAWTPVGRDGDGQIFDDGSYAIRNAGVWRFYPARPGLRAQLANLSDEWVNTGRQWVKRSQATAAATLAAVKPALDGYVERAEAAADTAVDAASNAGQFTGAARYETYLELLGDASAPVGARAEVWGDDDTSRNGFYDMTANGWEWAQRQPASAAALNQISTHVASLNRDMLPLTDLQLAGGLVHDDDGNRYVMSVGSRMRMLAGLLVEGGVRMRDWIARLGPGSSCSDGLGRTLYRVQPDGAMRVGSLSVRAAAGGGIYITDLLGRTAFGVTPKGRVIGLPQPVGGVGVALRHAVGFQRCDINHVIVYGQSLSRGATSIAPISTTQPYHNLTMSGGVLQRVGDSGYVADGFRPLVEEPWQPGNNNAESPTSGICNGFVRRAVEDGRAAQDMVLLGTSSGNGGTTVESLADTWLNRLKQQIHDAHASASAMGKTYCVMAHAYFQGEAQYSGAAEDRARDAWLYDQRITAMHEEIVRHAVATTGQREAPYMLTYQCSAHRRYGRDTCYVALQQWHSSRLNNWHILAVPDYVLPRNTDRLHLTAEGYWLMGEYVARALYWTLYRGAGRWRPLEPVDVSWTDTLIDVRYHVPCKPIVMDDALATSVPHAGFAIRDAADQVLDIIGAVEVIRDDTIRITLTAPAPLDATLTCGRGVPGDPQSSGPIEGPRTNIRDSHGLYDVVTSPTGTTYALHNASVIFEFNRQRGF